MIDFLEAFFNLFKAKIEEYKVVDNKISGTVGWSPEDDKQSFSLESGFDDSQLNNAKLLCVYLWKNNLVEGDRIIISEKDLLLRLIKERWNENDANEAINFLCSFAVKMVDGGEETDSFLYTSNM